MVGFFARLDAEPLAESLEALSVNVLAAQRASRVGLEPLGDAGRVEVVGRIARQGRHLVILGELTHTDDALGELLEVVWIELPQHDGVQHPISLRLLVLALLQVLLDH